MNYLKKHMIASDLNAIRRNTMKIKRTKTEAKSVTITAERLSDKSRITFTMSSDKTIEQLRTLLNHHLPPSSPNKFYLYSYQRGALINFHPSSFKLDYFPVIFDQSVLFLKMDDQNVNNIYLNNEKNVHKEIKRQKYSFLSKFLLPKTTMKYTKRRSSSSPTTITCLSIFKKLFHHRTV